MNDVICPYCNEEQEICHDDGYGYDESKTHNQECGDCGKTFTYTTSISFYYEAEKAPCLNGESHKWNNIAGFPNGYFSNRQRCKWCDKEEIRDKTLKYNNITDTWVKKD